MSNAEILDRGYRRYDGARGGTLAAMRSVTLLTMQHALGLRRSAWQKLLPCLTVFISYVPAIVFIGIVSLADTEEMKQQGEFFLPSYGEYYGNIILAIVLFSALVAPEVLCTDRRSGMLGLYLASPLNRDTYLVAKALGVAGVLAAVTLGPPLLMLIANTIDGSGPETVGEFIDLLWKVLLSGLIVTTLYTSFSLAAASFTTRRAAASATIVLVLMLSGIFVSEAISGGAAKELYFLNLFGLPIELVLRVYGDIETDPNAFFIPTWQLVVAYLGWIVVFLGFIRFRYQRFTVTR